jgi:hypothetical protein
MNALVFLRDPYASFAGLRRQRHTSPLYLGLGHGSEPMFENLVLEPLIGSVADRAHCLSQILHLCAGMDVERYVVILDDDTREVVAPAGRRAQLKVLLYELWLFALRRRNPLRLGMRLDVRLVQEQVSSFGHFYNTAPQGKIYGRYDHVSGARFRHGTALLRWRPDKAPKQCRMDPILPMGAGDLAALLRSA